MGFRRIMSKSEKTLLKLFQQRLNNFRARNCLSDGELSLKVLQNVLHKNYVADGYIPKSTNAMTTKLWLTADA